MLKFPTLGAAFAFAALAAAPANAQFKIRLGAETQIVEHVNTPSTTTWLTDQWRPSLVGMLGFYVLPGILSIDGEIAEAFRVNPPAGQSSRIGTTFRLGATLFPIPQRAQRDAVGRREYLLGQAQTLSQLLDVDELGQTFGVSRGQGLCIRICQGLSAPA